MQGGIPLQRLERGGVNKIMKIHVHYIHSTDFDSPGPLAIKAYLHEVCLYIKGLMFNSTRGNDYQ